MNRRRNKKKGQIKPPTLDDVWAEKVREQCALAIVAWLKGSVNTKRPISSLGLEEFKGMAEAATSKWIVLASVRIHEQPESPEASDLSLLLM